ncbi:MAG: flagellar motor switch protein FliM [Thermoleophilaceae bacterium]
MASSARAPRVREIDFRRPSKFNREQVRRIEVAHENFCQSAGSRLGAELRTEFQLQVLNTDQLPYSVVMAEEVPRHALAIELRLDELETDVVFILDFPLVHTMVARLLGGSADKAKSIGRSALTEIEIAVVRRIVNSMVGALSTTWDDLAGQTMSVRSIATSPMSVQIVSPSEPTLLLNLSAQIDGGMSIITLVVPHSSVETIMDRFVQGHYGSADIDDTARLAMRAAVGRVELEARAEVGAVELPLEHILGLEPGDVISLKRPASRGIVLTVEDRPAYVATPGRNGNLRAVQVRGEFSRGR